MKIKLFALLIFLPIISFAKEPHVCNSSMQSHPDIIDCIQISTRKIEDSIKEIIAKSGKEYSIDMAFYNSQRKSISERCSLYYSMEGQRIDLIENQCEYDGVEQLNKFIKTYMNTVDNY
ncbi:TPA: hypothetical protein ACWCE6_004822 [Escherichia coli]|uniref:hypothetical protein n=1 Tax=Escherichia coli TaxID=562 RepID=UPI0016925DB1|nr:hypothetical protein [Escherichia coli]HDQ6720885.1 hypothetical protein [Escherichia coli O146:H21]HDQ6880807.1 hypothetical protein [Escherichia coli O174:H8]HDQ6987277.1 hypothetical protein [Escherichia coli O113:H21]EEQ8054196.1 hypothetical protein [Escherichia coli]EEV0615568.1 hypothetical protein [Escherichia coli]